MNFYSFPFEMVIYSFSYKNSFWKVSVDMKIVFETFFFFFTNFLVEKTHLNFWSVPQTPASLSRAEVALHIEACGRSGKDFPKKCKDCLCAHEDQSQLNSHRSSNHVRQDFTVYFCTFQNCLQSLQDNLGFGSPMVQKESACFSARPKFNGFLSFLVKEKSWGWVVLDSRHLKRWKYCFLNACFHIGLCI